MVTGLRVNMKNKLMTFHDRVMLRKRYIMETINDLLKNTAQIVHSRHRSVGNFIMNLVSALGHTVSLIASPRRYKDIASKTQDNFTSSEETLTSFRPIAQLMVNVMGRGIIQLDGA